MTFTELFLVIKYMDSFVRTHENLQEVIREAFFVQLAVSWYCFRINPSRHLIVQVNNGNTRTMCEVCSKLTIKTPEHSQFSHSDVFIINFEQMNSGWESTQKLSNLFNLL